MDSKMMRKKTLRQGSKLGSMPITQPVKKLEKRNSFNEGPQITNIINTLAS